MRKISFVKTVEMVAEVPDDFFNNERGSDTIDTGRLVRWVEDNNCDTLDKEFSGVDQWYNHGTIEEIRVFPKDLEYCSSDKAEIVITKEEAEETLTELDNAERCYECGGYGDDYDSDGNCNCDTCPFNGAYND